MSMNIYCVVCLAVVDDINDALRCEGCSIWQHKECDGRISSDTYWNLSGDEDYLIWKCSLCLADDQKIAMSSIDSKPQLDSKFSDGIMRDPSFTGNFIKIEDQPLSESEESFFSDLPNNRFSSSESSFEATTYEILKGASVKREDKLYDSNGFSYTLLRKNQGGSRLWRCSVRTKKNICPASVTESKYGIFEKGRQSHNHPGRASTFTQGKIATKTRKKAIKSPFVSSQASQDRPCCAVQPMSHYSQHANYVQQKLILTKITTVDPIIDEPLFPSNFLRREIQTDDGACHVLFATIQQLKFLSCSKTWYVDTTFEGVNDQFCQLFSIHTFAKDRSIKQLPILFCLMSRRQKSDYVAVFRKVLMLLNTISVRTIVVDFEKAIWEAVMHALPKVKIKGCAYHYTKAVLRKIKELGLEREYHKHSDAHLVMKKLMSLCYMPRNTIKRLFNRLKRKNPDMQMFHLFFYMQKNWIDNKTWPPKTWSTYRMTVRTQNDVEGLNNMIKHREYHSMPNYQLLGLLSKEAEICSTQTKIISQKKIKRRRRKHKKNFDAKLYKLWKKYHDGRKTAVNILNSIAVLKGPCD